MNVNLVSDRPASISLLRIFAMILLGYVVIGSTVSMGVMALLYDGNLMVAIADPLGHPEIRNIMLMAQGLGSLVGLVLVPWYYLRLIEKRQLAVLFKEMPSWQTSGVVLLLTIAFAVAISPITEWNAGIQMPSWTGALGDLLTDIERQAEVLIKLFTSNLTPSTFILVFVIVAIVPALGEEFVFRGLIQTELKRALENPHAAIWLSAAIFSAFHFQFFGFFPRLLIGALLGYLYYWSGSLWLPVLAHFFNNGVQVIALYLRQLNFISFDVESTESAPLGWVAAAVVVTFVLLRYSMNQLSAPVIISSDHSS
ncbi:MAG: CPBP family intramembrane glutamic endopeptidase [Cytophagales bacterium]|nr:CPBP family intramembrane glutamic endopeptidase [Cytophagales bacterium]